MVIVRSRNYDILSVLSPAVTPTLSPTRTPPRADQPNPEQPIRPSLRRLPRTTARPVTPGTDTDAVAGSTVFVRATQVVAMEVRESSGEQRSTGEQRIGEAILHPLLRRTHKHRVHRAVARTDAPRLLAWRHGGGPGRPAGAKRVTEQGDQTCGQLSWWSWPS
jgi:hypothetical protein